MRSTCSLRIKWCTKIAHLRLYWKSYFMIGFGERWMGGRGIAHLHYRSQEILTVTIYVISRNLQWRSSDLLDWVVHGFTNKHDGINYHRIVCWLLLISKKKKGMYVKISMALRNFQVNGLNSNNNRLEQRGKVNRYSLHKHLHDVFTDLHFNWFFLKHVYEWQKLVLQKIGFS